MSTPVGFCDTCDNVIPFVDGGAAGRCLYNGITIIREGNTNADPCWWFPAERTLCDQYEVAKENK